MAKGIANQSDSIAPWQIDGLVDDFRTGFYGDAKCRIAIFPVRVDRSRRAD